MGGVVTAGGFCASGPFTATSRARLLKGRKVGIEPDENSPYAVAKRVPLALAD